MEFDNLIFLHVPKAAGSTLHPILERHFPKNVRHSFYDDVENRMARFRSLPLAERSRIRLLKGHFPYGLHDSLVGKTTYITLLRDPVERVVSHYYYVKRTPRHYLYDQVVSGKMSLADYVRSGITGELDNGQVRLLAGFDQTIPYGACTREHLDMAKYHAEQDFALVGLTERFDESLVLMCIVLGWTWLPYYRNLNVTKARPKHREIDPDIIAAIRETNRFDIELYEWVTERFNQLAHQHRDELSARLQRLSRINKVYQPVMGVVDGFKRSVFSSGAH